MKAIAALLLAASFFAVTAAAAAPPPEAAVVRSVKGTFEDVKQRLVMAIENRGLVLNYTARIGAMLERTGKDIGARRRIYGDAELLEFCSASASRATMEADPRNIVFCPYAIAVYTLPGQPGTVHLAWRRLQPAPAGSAKTLAAVEKLLADIVAEAVK